MSSERNPSETSPLLGPHANGHPSTGPLSNGYVHPRDSEAAERNHSTEEAHQKQVAHARNSLKYIVPAISIGVCQIASRGRSRPVRYVY